MPSDQEDKVGFAVFRTGGKQYRVKRGDVVRVERSDFFRLAAEPAGGNPLYSFDDVLAVQVNDRVVIGTPVVPGASVLAELLPENRLPKVVVFKKGRRKNRRTKAGHRQHYQPIRVVEIHTGGASDARPDPSAVPFESRSELSAAVMAARRGGNDDVLPLASRALRTNWAAWSPSDRKALAGVLSPHLIDPDPGVGAIVKRAVETLRPHRLGLGDVVSVGGPRRAGLALRVDVEPWAEGRPPSWPAHLQTFRIRAQVADLAGLRPRAGQVRRRAEPDFRFSGPGLDGARVDGNFRSELPPGLAADLVILVGVREAEGNVTLLDVFIEGERLRRFIDLGNLQVSQAVPALWAGRGRPAPAEQSTGGDADGQAVAAAW